MKKLLLVGMLVTIGWGQNNQNTNTTGSRNDSVISHWVPPLKTYAQLQALTPSSYTDNRFTVTDCLTSACTVGGGSVREDFQSNGTSWVLIGGGSGITCSSGTVNAATLQGLASGVSGEVQITTGTLGTFRYDQILVSETTQFVGGTGLTVSMGRTGANNTELTGTTVALGVSSGDANYWSARPIPPQLTTSYNLVLNFVVSSGNVNGVSAGVLTWQICGY